MLTLSRTVLLFHCQVNPLVDKSSELVSSEECEKLRSALVAAQESAAVQLLLECCLPRDEAERVSILLCATDKC